MNFKGLLLAGAGVFLIYIAVKQTYKPVWAALTKGGAGNAG